jgi:hypothetical protein
MFEHIRQLTRITELLIEIIEHGQIEIKEKSNGLFN